MPYIPFTEEQKRRANSVDLAEYLRRRGEMLIPSGPEYRLASDHSVTVRGREWYDHEAKEGGGPVSFLQTFHNLSYPEAVQRLLDGEGVPRPSAVERKPEAKPFALPPSSDSMRRVFAYLLKERHISREVLTAFVRADLLYEDAQYHNAVFVGTDERGAARHAHKRSTNSSGRSFQQNVEGNAPRYSFHWTGTSGSLYVFEAPIDLLAFLTLYPADWREHSYVALCGTSEQAMLWMLEQEPRLRTVRLCLDHDAAGIEAAGRLTDALRERGYEDVSVLRPEYKDWAEDLKAQNGLDAQPAEEHPQLLAAEDVCGRIAAKCANHKPDQANQRVQELFSHYRECVGEGDLEEAMDCAEEMAALALVVVLRECRQLGTVLTPEQGAQYLQSRVLPHQNRRGIKVRTGELGELIQTAVGKSEMQGVRSHEEKRSIASAWLAVVLACAKVSVKYNGDELKQTLRQEHAPAMEMG